MKVKSVPLPLHSWAQCACSWCVLLLSLMLTHSARAQVNWTLRDPLPTTAGFYSVAYGNSEFVAVGEAGTVFTSTDGAAWTAQAFPTQETLRFVSFVKNRFYARGDSGSIFSSPDGSGWSQLQGGNGGSGPVVESNGVLVTATSGSQLLLSTDGNAWETVSIESGMTLKTITASPTLFVAITATGGLLTSADGRAWTQRTPPVPQGFNEIVYGAGAFIGRGGSASPLYRSVDGVTWTAVTTGTATHLAFAGGRFYATDSLGFLLTSDDGLAWTAQASKPPIDTNTIASSGTQLLAVRPTSSGGARLYRSSDALTWVEAGSSLNRPSGDDAVAFAAGRFLTSGGFTSTDGANWSTNGYRAAAVNNTVVRPLGVNGRFIIFVNPFDDSQPSEVHLSVDGLTGSRVLTPSFRPSGVAYGNGRYVIVGMKGVTQSYQGAAVTSTDGSTWTALSDLPSGFQCRCIHFADNRFVAAGSDPLGRSTSLYTSTDGLKWTPASFPKTDFSPTGITYGAGRWLISTDYGSALTSTDGLTWSLASSTPNTYAITFANGYFVLGTQDWKYALDLNIATSVDGLHWTFRPVPKRIGRPDAFAFGNNVWVASRSGMLASAPAADPAKAPSLTTELASTTGLVLGESKKLQANVSGEAPLSYQWKYRGVPISGATENTYTIPAPTELVYGAVYTVEVRNSQGVAIGYYDGQVFQSSVPVIDQIQGSAPETAIWLSVGVQGPGPLTYQWLKNGAPVAGAIGSSVLLPFDRATDGFSEYSVIVTNASGSVTSSAKRLAPMLVTGPSSIVAQPGETVSFGVTIDSLAGASAQVQWRKNGQPYRSVQSATQPLLWYNVQPADAGVYDAVVSNSYGAITIPPVSLTVPTKDLPAITTQPSATTYPRGESITLTATPVGAGPYSYQWRLNGVPITGATSAVYTIAQLSSSNAGNYDVVITTPTATTTSDPIAITLRESSLVNLSARAWAGAAEDTMIVGFVLRGAPSLESPDVLVRSIGPTLTRLGVSGVLNDPSIRVMNNVPTLVAENDNWSTPIPTGRGVAVTAADLLRFGAFALEPGSRDSAVIVHEMPPGPHTALVAAIPSSSTGIVLNEIYGPVSGTQRLVNLSARARVSTGDNVLIAGFVIAGNSPMKVLIRGVGPTLANQGITHPLVNPRIVLFNAKGNEIHNNDNWGQAANVADLRVATTATGAFPLNEGSHDAAMLETLDPGVYTVHVASADGTSGVALVEIYEAP